jgi:histidinol-phosphate aminotransferase
MIDAMHRIRAPFNFSTSAQKAAIAALGDAAFVERSYRHNRQWRAWFAEQIAGMGNQGLRAIPSKANFQLVLFEGEVTGEQAYKALMDKGYIVRWLPGQGLPHGLRITIGTEEEIQGVARALREIVEG